MNNVITDSLENLMAQLKSHQSVKDKMQIARTHELLGDEVNTQGTTIAVGDDCAAIPNGDNEYLLFAAEGIVSDFIEQDPWFAGYSAVMVNISDVCAMGGLPIAVTDVLWAKDQEDSKELWQGMKAASEAYGVPIVGGHTCYNSEKKHLSVSILGKAKKLITSYDVQEGDQLLFAVDLNGAYYKEYPFWNASTSSSSELLKEKMEVLYEIANEGLCKAGKDVSMGGLLGTLQMLVHTCKLGAEVDLDKIPRVDNDLLRWLLAFPSYGYLLAVNKEQVDHVITRFKDIGVTAANIGAFIQEPSIYVKQKDQRVKF